MTLSTLLAFLVLAEAPATTPATTPATKPATTPATTPLGLQVDIPLQFTAQSPASANQTSIHPWLGVRVGSVSGAPTGSFVGGDGALLVGDYEQQGTNAVAMSRLMVGVEGRGLIGGRFSAAFASAGGYGFGGLLLGVGGASLTAYDDSRLRAIFTAGVRAGGGLLLDVGPVTSRLELGAGVRDFRWEVLSTFALGARF